MRIPEHLILASRSPRRIELLRSLSPDIQIEVSPPPSSDEQGFGDCSTMEAILTRIEEIAIHKLTQVCDHRLSCGIASRGIVIAADTVVIVPTADGKFRVLGQPPETDDWQPTVREWFTEYYAGKSHWVSSAVSMQTPAGKRLTGRATTTVTFREDVTCWLDWYLSTGESRGKAGGYAIQGLASIFVSRVEGSLSNVVGLPLEVLLQLFSSISESDHHGE